MSSATLFAQSFDVYQHDSYGLREVFPSKTYETTLQNNVVLEYNYVNGQKDLFPARELHFKENRIDIYEVDRGITIPTISISIEIDKN